ncbi:MAG: hypothetical protein WA746_15755 [Isosphaeraceae bacterium]
MRCIAIFTASLVGFFFGPLILASAQVARESRAGPPASTSQVTRLEVSRDTWVSEVGQEADGNNGGAPRLKLKSIQEMTLIDVDLAPLGDGRSPRRRCTSSRRAIRHCGG